MQTAVHKAKLAVREWVRAHVADLQLLPAAVQGNTDRVVASAVAATPTLTVAEVNRIATEAATAAVEDLRAAVTDLSSFVRGHLAGAGGVSGLGGISSGSAPHPLEMKFCAALASSVATARAWSPQQCMQACILLIQEAMGLKAELGALKGLHGFGKTPVKELEAHRFPVLAHFYPTLAAEECDLDELPAGEEASDDAWRGVGLLVSAPRRLQPLEEGRISWGEHGGFTVEPKAPKCKTMAEWTRVFMRVIYEAPEAKRDGLMDFLEWAKTIHAEFGFHHFTEFYEHLGASKGKGEKGDKGKGKGGVCDVHTVGEGQISATGLISELADSRMEDRFDGPVGERPLLGLEDGEAAGREALEADAQPWWRGLHTDKYVRVWDVREGPRGHGVEPALQSVERLVPVPVSYEDVELEEPYRWRLPVGVIAMGMVEKARKGKVKFHPVSDYSRPRVGGVNSRITLESDEFATVKEAFALLRPGYFMVKVDLENAYRSFGIASQYWSSRCFEYDGERYMDTRAPFGNRALPRIFMRSTRAIVAWMQAHGVQCVWYLDDFFCVGRMAAEVEENLMLLVEFVTFLGFAVNMAKCEGPVGRMEFLGILLSTEGEVCTAAIDSDRIADVLTRAKKLRAQAARGGIRRTALEGLMGLLAFCSQVLAAPVLEDLAVLERVLRMYDGRQVVSHRRGVDERHFATDASGTLGFGGIWERLFFLLSWADLARMPQRSWFPRQQGIDETWSINYMELFAVWWAVELWGHRMQGKTVVVNSDSQSALFQIKRWWGQWHICRC
ncbi:hypothetical protein CYMTET_28885 [Cymbomonas tetramitiformis]|uniref:Reverse transcriptase domain-containing protein n=1 Tax=Cymbomonas tetramitiformis TaxID=36881 RepID=A0AAE0FM87_9CHLO|nr:hypothetical protein CYMTET_28885 [Cymbomonas tetramitiformis]